MVIHNSRKYIAQTISQAEHNQPKKLISFQITSWLGFIGSVTGWCLIQISPLQAQITSDGTTGTEVNTTDSVTEITGGRRADSNLFHSFQDFSLATGNTAFFNNAGDISNIVSRVTGSNLSNIDGLIRANGSANLILINPNGIIFGANARLDLGGSFLGSTAESVVFADGTTFSASDTQVDPILTVNVPVGLQLGQNSASIQVQGTGNLGSDLTVNPGLFVTPGNTLALVGNGITFDGGTVVTESGRIELGSVAQGEVNLTDIAAGWQLGYEGVAQFSDLQLLAGSSVLNPNSLDNPDGGIQLRGQNINLERSQVVAQTLGETPGANININAEASLSLTSGEDSTAVGSQIINNVDAQASGNGGSIAIATEQLNISDRSLISSTTFGTGNSGDVNILAGNINLTGTGFAEFQQNFQLGALTGTLTPDVLGTGIFVGTVATGTAGDLIIDTESLSLSEGAIIFGPVFTQGIGGDINITADDIDISASAIQMGTSGITESSSSGDLNLNTNRLQIRDGGTIVNSTVGIGSAGNINLTVSESIEINNTPIEAITTTGIYANTFGSGAGGNLNISTSQLKINNGLISSNTGGLLLDGTIISTGGEGGNIDIQASESIESRGVSNNPAFTVGIGTSSYSDSDAGNLTISTGNLLVEDGTDFSTATLGAGTGGQLTINATNSIELIGTTNSDGLSQGGLLATSGRREFPNLEATGTSGGISINTPELTVRDGASIDVQNLGIGNAGGLNIEAEKIVLSDRASLSASTQAGEGGDIQITTDTLRLDRSLINASVLGSGTGGDINITASDSIEIVGSGFEFLQTTFFEPGALSPESLTNLDFGLVEEGILAATSSEGQAGTINIATQNLDLSAGGLISTTTLGEGAASSIFLDAAESITIDASIVSTSTIFNGQAGDISIDTNRLQVLAGSQVNTSTLGTGDGGNVTINADESITVSGATVNETLASSIVVGALPLTGMTGDGGDLKITTSQLNVSDRGTISVGSVGMGDAGSLDITANSIFLSNQGNLTASNVFGPGGSIAIETDTIKLDRGLINASVFGGGIGGDIQIEARDSVEVIGSGFEFLQQTFFNPGVPDPEALANLIDNIESNPITEGILAFTLDDGDAGTIIIETEDLQIRQGGLIAAITGGDGAGGSIFLNASENFEIDASIISSSSLFTGLGGDMIINTKNLEVLAGTQITTSTLGSGDSGDLIINASESITVAGSSTTNLPTNIAVGPQPLTTTTGNGGDLTITTERLNINDRGRISVNSTGTGNAGTLNINADSIFLDRQGVIFADTRSGEGGNIAIDTDNIFLQGNSSASARAVGMGDGGNITIDTNNLVLIENSQITADAIEGMGGNIQIDTQGLFICQECEITASSRLGVDGVIDIDTLQPSTQLEVLDIPQQLTQPQEVVAIACPANARADTSELTITGRGGLPLRPQEPLNSPSLITFQAPNSQAEQPSSPPAQNITLLPPPARSWYVDAKGTVVLSARTADTTIDNHPPTFSDCQ